MYCAYKLNKQGDNTQPLITAGSSQAWESSGSFQATLLISTDDKGSCTACKGDSVESWQDQELQNQVKLDSGTIPTI